VYSLFLNFKNKLGSNFGPKAKILVHPYVCAYMHVCAHMCTWVRVFWISFNYYINKLILPNKNSKLQFCQQASHTRGYPCCKSIRSFLPQSLNLTLFLGIKYSFDFWVQRIDDNFPTCKRIRKAFAAYLYATIAAYKGICTQKEKDKCLRSN